MTKAEFVDRVARSVRLTKKDTEAILETAFATMSLAIREEKRFSYPRFGTFALRERKARRGRNPRTGEIMAVKASRSVGFKPAPALRERL